MEITVIRSHVREDLTQEQDLKTAANGVGVMAKCLESMLLGEEWGNQSSSMIL